MPMYYFRLQDEDRVEDTEGVNLDDDKAAREHATTVAQELTFRRPGMLGRDWSLWTLSVHDDQRREVVSFNLGDFRGGKGATES